MPDNVNQEVLVGIENVRKSLKQAVNGLETWTKTHEDNLSGLEKNYIGLEKNYQTLDERYLANEKRFLVNEERFQVIETEYLVLIEAIKNKVREWSLVHMRAKEAAPSILEDLEKILKIEEEADE